MKKYLYFIYDHLANAQVRGPMFTTKADARRLRNTMNALAGVTPPTHNPRAPVPIPPPEMRYTINRVETLGTGQ